MNTKKILVLILVLIMGIFFTTTLMQAQRTRDSSTQGGISPTGIGSVGIPHNPDETTRTNAVELKINDKLTARLKTLLPEGSDPHYLSKGFGELKDFVTTVRASNNLKVSFGELKNKMVDGSSKGLQKAIHELKPDVDPKAETKKAGEQAKQDIKESK